MDRNFLVQFLGSDCCKINFLQISSLSCEKDEIIIFYSKGVCEVIYGCETSLSVQTC